MITGKISPRVDRIQDTTLIDLWIVTSTTFLPLTVNNDWHLLEAVFEEDYTRKNKEHEKRVASAQYYSDIDRRSKIPIKMRQQ